MINLKELEYFVSNNSPERVDEYFKTSISKIEPLTKKLNDATKWMTVILILYFFFIEGILNEITILGVKVEDWKIFRPFFLPVFCSISFYYMVVTINREEIRYLVKILFNTRFNVVVDNKNWLAGNNVIDLQRFYFPFSFRYEIDKLKGKKLFGWTDLLYAIPFLIFQWIIFAFLKNEVKYAFKNIDTYWFSKYVFVLSCFLLLAWLWVFMIMIVKGVRSKLIIDGFIDRESPSASNEFNMKNLNDKPAWILIVVGVLVIIIFTLFGNFLNTNGSLSPQIMANYGTFIGGTAGIIFTLAGYFLIFSTLKTSKKQQFEITFHNRFSLFQEFRSKQIALKVTDKDNGDEKVHYGILFFDYLFTKQMEFNKGEKKNIQYFTKNFEIHRAQFEQYFGFFEMCLSSLFESNLTQKDITRNADFLQNLLSEQEKLIFSIMKHIVNPHQFPLCLRFSNRFHHIYEATVLLED